MRKLRTALLAGAGVMLIAGAAVAANSKMHVLNVSLPDGTVAQIHYEGDAAPKIVVQQAPAQRIALADPFAIAFGPGMFAGFDRMAAMMEARSRAMMQQVAQMQQQMRDNPGAMRMASSDGKAPAGVVQYSYVSTTSSNGCTTSVSWSSDGSGAQPKVVKTSAGQCDRVKATPQKTAAEPAQPAPPAKAATPATPATVPGADRT